MSHSIELSHVGEHRRNGEPLGELGVADERGETVGVDPEGWGNEMKFGAGGQRSVNIKRREIEVKRRMTGVALERTESEVVPRPLDECDDV